MAGLINWKRVAIPVGNPDASHVYVGIDISDGKLYTKDSSGVVTKMGAAGGQPVGFLQYSNSATFNMNVSAGISTVIPLDTDNASNANGKFTKISTTQFRADFNGHVKVSYGAAAYSPSNDRGWLIGINKNGTDLGYTQKNGSSLAFNWRINYSSGVAVIACATNDIFELRLEGIENIAYTIDPGDASMLIEVYEEV